jgi:hypothetical protein
MSPPAPVHHTQATQNSWQRQLAQTHLHIGQLQFLDVFAVKVEQAANLLLAGQQPAVGAPEGAWVLSDPQQPRGHAHVPARVTCTACAPGFTLFVTAENCQQGQ